MRIHVLVLASMVGMIPAANEQSSQSTTDTPAASSQAAPSGGGVNAARVESAEGKLPGLTSSLAERPINARRYCVGDGRADDTDSLRQAIAAAKAGSGTLYLPAGAYRITDTIDLGRTWGLRIIGAGAAGQAFSTPGDNNGVKLSAGEFCGTALVWDGPENQPMIRCDGSGLTLDGVSLWGRGKASAGLLVAKGDGVGSGHHRIKSLAVNGCGAAVQCGEQQSDGNCADLTIGRLDAEHCGAGLRVVNDQGVNYSIQHLNTKWTGVAVDTQAGGRVDVQFAHLLESPLLLRVGDAGSQTANFRFGQVAFDAQQAEAVRLVEQTGWGPLTVSIQSGRVAGGDRSLLNLKGEAVVSLRDMDISGPELLSGTAGSMPHRAIHVLLDHCRLSGDLANDASGPATVLRRECVDFRARPVTQGTSL